MSQAIAIADGIYTEIEIHCWQYGDRLSGWSGDAGQSGRLATDSTVRLFL